jgi:DNA-binding MarR family transcriptional regulator
MHLKDDPRWLAWYSQVSLHTRLLDELGAEMERRTGLAATWFEVLVNLKNGPVRMNELADALFLSRGGATRLVARMEQAGLVVRETPLDDRRATFAMLTDEGSKALERALPVHLELIHEGFGRHLEPGEAEVLIAVAGRVAGARGWPVKQPPVASE